MLICTNIRNWGPSLSPTHNDRVCQAGRSRRYEYVVPEVTATVDPTLIEQRDCVCRSISLYV